MVSMQRENHVLRAAVALLSCVVLADVVTTGQQGQQLPGPGSGVVDVKVVSEAPVAAAQRGDWRVAQQGDWRVGVQGAVATLPSMPPFVKVGGAYWVRGPSLEMVVTVRALDPSGWARVENTAGEQHWINLAAMSSIVVR